MAFFFASRDFGEMTLRINYMKRYNRMREAKASELDSLSAVLQDEVKRLDTQLAQLETSRSNRDKELQTLRADEQTYKRTVRGWPPTNARWPTGYARRSAKNRMPRSSFSGSSQRRPAAMREPNVPPQRSG